jgi:hypothetical protein
MAVTRLGLGGAGAAYVPMPFLPKQFHAPPSVVPVSDILVYASPVESVGI